MNLVRMGSLVAARRKDSRARASGTPSTSNNTLAGRMTATHDSSGPLPLPMRVSSGFFVKDFCGKMRIHTLPRRFMLRLMATRAASICLVSSQQRSSDIKPYSPKATVFPREATPARLPRCILRYFTLAGINGIANSSSNQQPPGSGLDGHRLGGPGFLGFVFTFANPAFDAEFAVNGEGLGKSIIDVRPQGVQRHPAFVIDLDPGQFCAPEAAGATNFDPFGAEVHRRLEGLLHGATEGNAPFQLQRDVLRHQLGIGLRLLDFHDVDVNLLARHLAQFLLELVDLGALAADDHARAGGEDGDPATGGRALDQDLRHAGRLELFLERVANPAILGQQFAEVLLVRIP